MTTVREGECELWLPALAGSSSTPPAPPAAWVRWQSWSSPSSLETLLDWTCLFWPDLTPHCVCFLTAKPQQKHAAGTIAQRQGPRLLRLPPRPLSSGGLA